MNNNTFAIITTVQEPTASVRLLAEHLKASASSPIIIGDSKGPVKYELVGAELWTLKRQMLLTWDIVPLLQFKSYARKNLGYLLAISRGADCIYETDDDNAPHDDWKLRNVDVNAVTLANHSWVNVYKWFTDEHIWPRGFPLDIVRDTAVQIRRSGGAGVLKCGAYSRLGLWSWG
jgi:hypothetical protein